MKSIENILEILIFNSRWLLAPFYLGLVVGDVVKILRYSFTVGHDVYYRIVVDSEDFY